MESATDPSEIVKHLHRLRADHRRMGIIYGTAIIIVTLTITYFVLFTPNFQMTFSSPSLMPGAYQMRTHDKSGQNAPATSTRP